MHKFGVFCLFLFVSSVLSVEHNVDHNVDHDVECDNFNQKIIDYFDLNYDNNVKSQNRKLLVNIENVPVKQKLKKGNVTIDIKNIEEFHNVTTAKLTNLKQRVENMLVEIIKKETESMNSILFETNKTSLSVNHAFLEYKQSHEKLISIRNNINELNKTMVDHYLQMNKDTIYLRHLTNIKPGFLKSLDSVNRLLAALENTIHNKIIDSEEKTKLVQIIFDLKNSTQYTTNDLAKKFLEHYEKYKKHYHEYKLTYAKTSDQLQSLLKEYNNEKLIVSGFYKEYSRILQIFKKLQLNYKYSKEDVVLMEEIFRNLKTILSGTNSKCLANSLKSTNPDNCSLDLLKSHIKNNLI